MTITLVAAALGPVLIVVGKVISAVGTSLKQISRGQPRNKGHDK